MMKSIAEQIEGLERLKPLLEKGQIIHGVFRREGDVAVCCIMVRGTGGRYLLPKEASEIVFASPSNLYDCWCNGDLIKTNLTLEQAADLLIGEYRELKRKIQAEEFSERVKRVKAGG